MKRWLVALVAGLVLAAAGGSALVLSNDGSAVANDRGTSAAQQTSADDGLDEKREGDRGSGPPPWAHGHGHAKAKDHGPGKAWKALTPEQRADLMRRLSSEHADGMKAYADCVRAERSDCEKPLPPGQAKRR